MERLAFQSSDLDALWEAQDEFWGQFSDADWRRRHGRDWTYADVLYHLTYFNQVVIDAIQRKPDAPLPKPLATLRALDEWNEQQFSRHSTYQDMEQAKRDFKASQIALREASHNFNRPIFLPLLRVGGWRTLDFALEYTFYHNWSHFTEAHLRRYNWLPGLPNRMVHIGLDFLMDVIAGSASLDRAGQTPLRWALHLTDIAGGTWTFEISSKVCTLYDGQRGHPHITTTMSINTFLKTNIFGMGSPALAALAGRIHIQGNQHTGKLRRLFKESPDLVWPLMERGRAESPTP